LGEAAWRPPAGPGTPPLKLGRQQAR